MPVESIVSLALLAAAAVIALFCDYLRVKNTRLRQAVADLEARNRACNEARESAATNARRSDAFAERIARRKGTSGRPAPQIGAGNARPIQRRNKDDAATSRKALSEWLIQRAAARAAQKMAGTTVVNSCGTSAPIPGHVPLNPILKPFAVPRRPVPVSVDAYLWDFLSVETAIEPFTKAGMGFELIQGSGASNQDLEVPAGVHTSTALERLRESRNLFTGLVISIAVNRGDHSTCGDESPVDVINGFLCDLLGSSDFGCPVSNDEFLLICPGVQGAEAQRHLSDVSERLWDLQLRMIGQFSIEICVGAADIRRESLSEAIEQANERMGQTRRNRDTLAAGLAARQRQAV